MQTASRPLFLSAVQGGPHLLVVADEVHRIGSTAFSQALTISSGARLGLSATPVRFGDPAGTARIFAYFGDELLPKFGIPEAIAAGRLVPYDYYVHNVQLTGSEQEDWNELTDVIKREYARAPKASDGTRTQTERLKLLLYRRAAIVKQAAGKIAIAAEVVGSQFLSGDRWLVYCDSQDQLREVVRTLRELDLPAFEYHTAMESDRTSTLQHFMTHGGIVVAIRCLDEGIDIPSVNKALVLASSTNSRQFIQRRGRVLRKSPDKLSAEVHDCLVLPASAPSNDDGTMTILRTELRRCAEFASSARNTATAMRLKIMAAKQGLDDFDLMTGELEDADDE
jgi:superfamily II DNA or RNA helicase